MDRDRLHRTGPDASAGPATPSADPQASQRTDNRMVRVKIVRRYRYKIFYRIVDDRTVEILHVRHTSRRPWEVPRHD